jgi:uncharacterized protein YlxP (DUF503 family)
MHSKKKKIIFQKIINNLKKKWTVSEISKIEDLNNLQITVKMQLISSNYTFSLEKEFSKQLSFAED